MSYLHSNNIIHRDLNPENIFLDEHLFPKIGDFGLSKREHSFDTMTYQSTAGMRGNPTYSSPEILQFKDYSKSGDVYSYGFIIFEIITKEIPFKEFTNKNEIFNEVVIKCNRPQIPSNVPTSYRELIERCWSQEMRERPTFEDIVKILKTEPSFITDTINQERFNKYVEFIEESRKSFETNRRILDLKEFIEKKSKINEEGDDNNNNTKERNENESESESEMTEDKEIKVIEEVEKENEPNEYQSNNETKTKTKTPKIEENIKENSNKIKETEQPKNQNKIEEIQINQINENSETEQPNETETKEINEIEQSNIKIQIDETQTKQTNEICETELNNELDTKDTKGTKNTKDTKEQEQTNQYCEENKEERDIETITKLAQKYIEDNDTENIYKYIVLLIESGESLIPIEYAFNLYKKGHFKVSYNYFSLISTTNNPIAQYFIGIMKFKGQGCEQNLDESYELLKHLSQNGIDRATEFLEDNFQNKIEQELHT